MKGKIIVFEGLDYSFKETNSKQLYQYIKQNITDKVLLYSFPNYNSESSIFIKKYLNEEYGKSSNIDPYRSSIYYIIDRLDTICIENIQEKYNDGYIIIFDRYSGSNMIYQSVKFKNKLDKFKFIDWCIDLEFYKLKLPKPDITLYMDMPLDISYKLLKKRKYKNNCIKDGHEDNYIFMKKIESDALYIVDYLNWFRIKCNDNFKIKNKDDIFKEILYKLRSVL